MNLLNTYILKKKILDMCMCISRYVYFSVHYPRAFFLFGPILVIDVHYNAPDYDGGVRFQIRAPKNF